jgi:hypothetical protein
MGFSPRNLSRSLPTDPHSPHACSTPGVYTFSVTWTVLRLLTSLALGYNNRPDQKSPGSVAATRFLPGVLSFLCTLSLLERVLLHWPTSHTQSSTAWPQQSIGKTDTGFPTGSTMANGLTDMASNKTPRIGSILRQRMFWLFSINTQASGSVDVRGISCRGRTGCPVQKIGKNGEEPLSRLILVVYSHAPGLTLVTLGTACVPSACILFARFPLARNLG